MGSDNMKEIWKDIKDYEGLYQVSNLGRVKSIERQVERNRNGKVFYLSVPEKILKENYTKTTERHPMKRATVELWKENKRKRYFIHRLVAEAFIENPLNKPQVNHIDGNPLNNKISNLEWTTNKENTQHAYDNGLMKPKGTKPIKAIKDDEILLFDSCGEAARYFNVSSGAIRAALKGYGRSKGACGYKWFYQ